MAPTPTVPDFIRSPYRLTVQVTTNGLFDADQRTRASYATLSTTHGLGYTRYTNTNVVVDLSTSFEIWGEALHPHGTTGTFTASGTTGHAGSCQTTFSGSTSHG